MKKSIRAQMTLTLLVSVGILMLFGITLLYFLVKHSLQTQFDLAMKTKIELLTMFPEVNREGIDLEFTDHHMPEFENSERGEYYQIWLHNNTVLSKSKSLGNYELPFKYGTLAQPVFWNIVLPNGHPGRAIGVGFLPASEDDYSIKHTKDQTPFAMILVFARDRTSLDHLLSRVRWSIIIIATIMLLLTVWIVTKALLMGLAPLRMLAQKVEDMEADSLISSNIFPEELPTELAPIATELNLLANRLNNAFQREQRLTADMAHEMNTPLAELYTAAEVALKWSDDPETVSDLAQQTLTTVANLQKVTHALLMLSRHKNKTNEQLQPVNISDIWKEVRELYSLRAKERHIRIHEDILPSIEVKSNPELLKIILSNLLDNAIAYSPIDATISVKLSVSAIDAWQFSMENQNKALQPKDLEYIFEPLWRHDASRTNSRHAGLGLSLVKAIATRLNLSISAHLPDNKLFLIVLVYPLNDAQSHKYTFNRGD